MRPAAFVVLLGMLGNVALAESPLPGSNQWGIGFDDH